jgi:hypothetical protein
LRLVIFAVEMCVIVARWGCATLALGPASDTPAIMQRSTPPLAQVLSLSALLLFLVSSVSAQKSASPNPQSSLPHDQHAGMTVSAAPLTDPSRAKHVFGKANPLEAGILPVEVFLRNDTAQPIQIGLDTIELDIHYQSGRMDNIQSLAPAQVAGAIAHPHGPAAPRERRFPIGMAPIGDKKTQKALDAIRPLALNSDIVPPMGSIHGYLFFDLKHDVSLVNQSSLYIPDAVIIPSKKPLIFFEVSFAKP